MQRLVRIVPQRHRDSGAQPCRSASSRNSCSRTPTGTWLYFQSADYRVFQGIVDSFQLYPADAHIFECKSLETMPKRLYVDGFERYDLAGIPVEMTPKELENRALPHVTLHESILDPCWMTRRQASDSYREAIIPVSGQGARPRP